MEEIQQDLLAAKESGDLDKIKETLLRAKAAGGGGTDPATIDQALKDCISKNWPLVSVLHADAKCTLASPTRFSVQTSVKNHQDVDTAIAGADPGANARKRAEESKLKGNASLKEGKGHVEPLGNVISGVDSLSRGSSMSCFGVIQRVPFQSARHKVGRS